jgi:hypothetical protein
MSSTIYPVFDSSANLTTNYSSILTNELIDSTDWGSALSLFSPRILSGLIFTEQYVLTDPALTALAGLIPLHIIHFVYITITQLPNFHTHWRALGIMGHAMATVSLLRTQTD